MCTTQSRASVGPNWFDARERYRETDAGYETPCWLWTLSTVTGGYGQVSIRSPQGQRAALAHVLYWEREHGPVPSGLQLDHLCCNPSCVRPDHMEPVTCTENNRRRRSTRIDMETARMIRAFPGTTRATAREFGISASLVSAIRRCLVWRETTAEPAGAGDKRPLVRYERAGHTVEGRLDLVTDAVILVDVCDGDDPVMCWAGGEFNLERIG